MQNTDSPSRTITADELHIYRRHLKLSISDAALIAGCNNLEWMEFEVGDVAIPQEVIDRLSAAADEYRRMVDVMRNHPKHTLPRFIELAEFRQKFHGGSVLACRVYYAIVAELVVSYAWSATFDDHTIPEDSPLNQLCLTL